MDHIPYPSASNPHIQKIEVPYLEGYEFDHADFASFPGRIGFMRNGRLDLQRRSYELAAMAQAWLWFGLIDAYTERHLDRRLFIRQGNTFSDSHPRMIDSTKLEEVLRLRIYFVYRWPVGSLAKGLSKRRQSLLLIASRACFELDGAQHADPVLAAVILSIKMLLWTLIVRTNTADNPQLKYQITADQLTLHHLTVCSDEESMTANILMDRMLMNGWCIHQITHLCQLLDICTIYYLSSLKRHERRGVSHASCSTTHCGAYDTSETTYKMRHVSESCTCDFIDIDNDSLNTIVRNGGVPLVTIEHSASKSVQLRVVKCKPQSRYTAISHVWIDGLGNPGANALPTCQLIQIGKQLNVLAGPRRRWSKTKTPLFWIDTLCVPTRPQDAALRMKAINRMALIYAGARQVLVLDSEISQVAHLLEPVELVCARILCSKWNTRCWTLQEGALAQRCFFQFHRSAYRLEPRISVKKIVGMEQNFLRQDLTLFGRYTLQRSLIEEASRVAHIDSSISATTTRRNISRESLKVKFIRTWNDIGRRATTKAEDVHIILANLTGFSAAQIMSLHTSTDRTKMMLDCIGEFPLAMIYCECDRPNAGEDHADRWVPSAPGHEIISTYPTLKCTPNGLLLRADALEMPTIFILNSGSHISEFCFSVLCNGSQIWCRIRAITAQSDKLHRHRSQPICLILPIQLEPLGRSTSKSISVRGARLLLDEQHLVETGNLLACFDCPVLVMCESSPPQCRKTVDSEVVSAIRLPIGTNLLIEHNIDGHLRQEFVKRSRYSYYDRRTRWASIIPKLGEIIFMLVLLLYVALVILQSMGYLSPSYLSPSDLMQIEYLDIQRAYSVLLALLTPLLIPFWFGLMAIFKAWHRARVYRAWSATFEEDWEPEISTFERIRIRLRRIFDRGVGILRRNA